MMSSATGSLSQSAASKGAGSNSSPPKSQWETHIGRVDVAFGAGRLRQLGERAVALAGKRPLLVSDNGVVAAGYARLAEQSLSAAGLAVSVFAEVEENPSEANVAAGAEQARAHNADLIVAIGGGSVLDCAKGINFLVTNGGRMRDYRGYGKTSSPLLPSVGIPSTAGTGSEAQSFALISHDDTHIKMACGAVDAGFRTVLLDPELLVTVPRAVAAATGLDAVSHAVESFASTGSNPISRLLSKKAWQLLDSSFESYLATLNQPGSNSSSAGPNYLDAHDAIERMLLGAHLAGAAIEKSMLGAAHACANPLTARFGVTHGIAVALLLPAVVEFNGAEVGAAYAALQDLPIDGSPSPSQRLVARLQELNRIAGIGVGLKEYGVPHETLPGLAETAFEQWTARFNPRQVDVDQLLECYEASF